MMNELRTTVLPSAVGASLVSSSWIIWSDMHQALRIDKRNVLRFGRINPEDVIRVKIARLEEAHANLALVAKQIQGFVHQLRCVVVYVCLEIVQNLISSVFSATGDSCIFRLLFSRQISGAYRCDRKSNRTSLPWKGSFL